MADLLDFSVTAGAAKSVTVPSFTISARVVESGDQSRVIADLTGAAAIQFPAVVKTLSAADLDEFVQLVAAWLVRKRAGL